MDIILIIPVDLQCKFTFARRREEVTSLYEATSHSPKTQRDESNRLLSMT